MLSKSKGQVLRIAAVIHVLFHMDTPRSIPMEISEDAVQAADFFVDYCLQHAAYLGGRGDFQSAVEEFQQGAVISHLIPIRIVHTVYMLNPLCAEHSLKCNIPHLKLPLHYPHTKEVKKQVVKGYTYKECNKGSKEEHYKIQHKGPC